MSATPMLYAFGPFLLDPAARSLQRDGEPMPLTPKAFDVLSLLVSHRGSVVTKEALLAAAWPGIIVDENNLAFQISTLRKALSAQGDGARYIATIPGKGYQFVGAVVETTATAFISAAVTELVVEEEETTVVEVHESSASSVRGGVLFLVGACSVLLLVLLYWNRARPVAQAPPSRGTTLAVLPFKAVAVADRDEALELGMADTLISRISSVADLTVRPLSSVRRYGALDQDPFVAGRQLGVDAVLDGSIQRSGERIRVTARLLRVADGRQLWSGNFDEPFNDIFAVQDTISSRLATALALRLTDAERNRLAHHPTRDLEAYRAYAEGRLRQLRSRAGDQRESVGYFERAIALDKNYAAAYAGLADAWAVLPLSADEPPAPSFVKARRAADHALMLDPHLSDAYTARGTVKFWHDWDWPGAEADFRRAIELNRGSALARMRLGHLFSNIGRHAEARAEALEAQKLEPLSPIVATLSAQYTLQSGDLIAAEHQLNRVLSRHPDFWLARLNLGSLYERQKRYDEALVELRRASAASGQNGAALTIIGYIHAIRGERAAAEQVLAQLLATSRTRYVKPTRLALVNAAIGNHDEAFALLRRACRERDLGLVGLANPRWQLLANDSRFEEIRQCVDLPLGKPRKERNQTYQPQVTVSAR